MSEANWLNSPTLNNWASKTGLKPAYAAGGGAALVAVFVIALFGLDTLCLTCILAYPLLATLKCTKTFSQPESMFWLTYWTLYGLLSLLEAFTDFLIVWIPAWWLIKTAFMMWCFLPQSRGAAVVFSRVIDPVLTHFELGIDASIAHIRPTKTT